MVSCDTSDDEDDSPRDPNPEEGWDDGEVYDAYQDGDEGYYDDYEEDEGGVRSGGMVVEDVDWVPGGVIVEDVD